MSGEGLDEIGDGKGSSAATYVQRWRWGLPYWFCGALMWRRRRRAGQDGNAAGYELARGWLFEGDGSVQRKWVDVSVLLGLAQGWPGAGGSAGRGGYGVAICGALLEAFRGWHHQQNRILCILCRLEWVAKPSAFGTCQLVVGLLVPWLHNRQINGYLCRM